MPSEATVTGWWAARQPVIGNAPETSPANSHFMIVTVLDSVIDLWTGEGKLDPILHALRAIKASSKAKSTWRKDDGDRKRVFRFLSGSSGAERGLGGKRQHVRRV
jgi:hypothetical protein